MSPGSDRPLASRRSLPSELLLIVTMALAVYLLIAFVAQTVHVLGQSMYPTLHNDDYLISSKLDYRLHPPQRGDIVTVRDPYDASKDFIKRVVGLPGETISVRAGHVCIDHQRLAEPYVPNLPAWVVGANMAPLRLAHDAYFVMGDNRNNSTDSRAFGPITRSHIESKAYLRVWPLRTFGPLGPGPRLASAAASGICAAA
ncbi:MAG: signal peptidase I [Candidatus Dormibacteraceae bacterium]